MRNDSLYFKVLWAWKCSSTHHKMALDALWLLRGTQSEPWRLLFWKYADSYLKGAEAPDIEFKDYRNHVVHVQENYWGGARKAAVPWYERLVIALQARRWSDAAYCAGVLSHYYTDAIQPLHTDQSVSESGLHWACERSITQSYDELKRILLEELEGYPEVEVLDGKKWLARMIEQGAERAHPHYQVILDHYDMGKGMKNPRLGLDQELKDRLARLIGYATVGWARILERAISEAQVVPPTVSLTLETLLSTMTIPTRWVARKLAERKEQAAREAMDQELKEKGRILEALSEEEKTIRQLHAAEVLKIPIHILDEKLPSPTGTKHGTKALKRSPGERSDQDAPQQRRDAPHSSVNQPTRAPTFYHKRQTDASGEWRFHLELDVPVSRVPFIGPKSAERLQAIGVRSVGDLLELSPEVAAERLAVRHIKADTILAWQAQAQMMYRIPHLRGQDAQILVCCGITRPEKLARMHPQEVLARVGPFVASREGRWIIGSGKAPDLDEVTNWIIWAKNARPLQKVSG